MKKHPIHARKSLSISWPFNDMKVGDKIVLSGTNAKSLRARGMSAARHYMNTRGYVFQSDRTDIQEYTIIRVS